MSDFGRAILCFEKLILERERERGREREVGGGSE
jgi:hypothetical protein